MPVMQDYSLKILSYVWNHDIEETPVEKLLIKGLDAAVFFLDLRSPVLRASLSLLDKAQQRIESSGYNLQNLTTCVVTSDQGEGQGVAASKLRSLLHWRPSRHFESSQIDLEIFSSVSAFLQKDFQRKLISI